MKQKSVWSGIYESSFVEFFAFEMELRNENLRLIEIEFWSKDETRFCIKKKILIKEIMVQRAEIAWLRCFHEFNQEAYDKLSFP